MSAHLKRLFKSLQGGFAESFIKKAIQKFRTGCLAWAICRLASRGFGNADLVHGISKWSRLMPRPMGLNLEPGFIGVNLLTGTIEFCGVSFMGAGLEHISVRVSLSLCPTFRPGSRVWIATNYSDAMMVLKCGPTGMALEPVSTGASLEYGSTELVQETKSMELASYQGLLGSSLTLDQLKPRTWNKNLDIGVRLVLGQVWSLCPQRLVWSLRPCMLIRSHRC